MLWEPASGNCVATWTTGHTDSVWKMVQLADGRLVTASYDHTLKVWDNVAAVRRLDVSLRTK
jgi:WD40 repeat protein